MCGIFGYLASRMQDIEIILPKLNLIKQLLNHRGPDAFSFKIIRNSNLILLHTRLSIIDLSESANQPMSNEDESIWLVYNGEFYTYKYYIDTLKEKGHRFKSQSDSEVIIHLYEEYGLEFIKCLRGMFSLGIWDENKKALILVRDRVGKKPLYYSFKDGIFSFASELKALVALPHISKDIDFDALNLFFAYGYIPCEYSIFKDIRKLMPGHMLCLKNSSFRITNYYDIHPRIKSINFDDAQTELLDLLKDSVKFRLVSDVPVGILLSGGVDSSLVASLAALVTNRPLKTFSIGFEEQKFNELPYARLIADHIKSDHYEYTVKLNDTIALEQLGKQLDEPFADSSALPTFLLSKMARNEVKVVLSGDGGDELFGGYNWYLWVLSLAKWNQMLIPFAQFIGYIARKNFVHFRGKRFLQNLGIDLKQAFFNRISIFNEKERKQLLNPVIANIKDFNKPEKFLLEYTISPDDNLINMRWFDFKNYLPEDILTKIDRCSMAVSLEVRAPLLDHKIIEFAFNLPSKYIIKNRITKYILKTVAKSILPPDFNYARKWGFNIPLDDWFKKDLSALLCEKLINLSLPHLINSKFVLNLINSHKEYNAKNGVKLWSVLMFSIWLENYL